VIAAIDDRERKAGFGVGIDQNRKNRRQVELGAIVFTDRHPFAGCGLRYAVDRRLDIGRHHFPFAGIFIQNDMAFGLKIAAPLAVPAERHLDAIDILRRC